MKKFARFLRSNRLPLAGGALLVPLFSHAAIDVTAATTGISDAQTATLAVLAAMITMAAAVFGVRKVLRLLGGGR